MRVAKLSDFNFGLSQDERWACGRLGENGKDAGKPVDCDRLSGPEYYSGFWLEDRESSTFTFTGEKRCWDDHTDAINQCIELQMTSEEASKIPGRLWECTQIFRLEFVGRHTVRPVSVSMGYPSHAIVVDRIISAKRLRPAKPAHNICGGD